MTIIGKRGLSAALAAVGVCALAAGSVQAADAGEEPRTPAPAIAIACDGYGPATDKSDGLSLLKALFGTGFTPATANSTLRGEARFGSPGVRACDMALSILPPKHWRRRVNLLQARAMHHLSLGEMKEAVADLDLAKASAAQPDAYFQRSLGLGNDLIRAYAMRRDGDVKGASALATQAWQARPYNRLVALSALTAMDSEANPGPSYQVIYGLAKLTPSVTEDLFWRAMEERRFSDAIMFYESMIPRREYGDEPISSGEQVRLDLANAISAEQFWANNAGPYAYALAATGKPEKAKAVIAATRERMLHAQDIFAKAVPAGADTQFLAEMRREGLRALLNDRRLAVNSWDTMLDQRQMATDGRANEVMDTLRRDPVPNSPISIDLVDLLIANVSGEYKVAVPALEDLKRQLAAGPEPKPKKKKSAQDIEGLDNLYEQLPDSEAPARVPGYGKKANFWTGDQDAYNIKKNPDGSVTVIYYGLLASRIMVEELALLHAADLALKAGKPGLLVTGRKDYQHTTTMSYYGIETTSYHSGFDTRLDMLFVDPGAMPAGYEQAGWRVIDAQAVYDALGPIYGAPVQSKRR